MRWIGVDTSCRRGTVALVDDRGVQALEAREQPNAHGEALVGMLDAALASAGWRRVDIDAIAVGIGPGSFTGLRVGIAFCQGLALALDRPIVGVGSLAAMSRAVPTDRPGARCAVLDARRNEYFVAIHEASAEVVAPRAIPQAGAAEVIADLHPNVTWIVGEAAASIPGPWRHYRSPSADLPHAACVVLTAREMPRPAAEPLYLRPVDAIRPRLPPSPLS